MMTQFVPIGLATPSLFDRTIDRYGGPPPLPRLPQARAVSAPVRRLGVKDLAIVGLLGFLLVATYAPGLYWVLFRTELPARSDPVARLWSVYGAADRAFYDRPTAFAAAYQTLHLLILCPPYAWLMFAIVKGKPVKGKPCRTLVDSVQSGSHRKKFPRSASPALS